MRNFSLILLAIIFYNVSFAEDNFIYIKSGKILKQNDFKYIDNNAVNYLFLSFDEIPSNDFKNQMSSNGISFLEYLPTKTYIISIKNKIDLNELKKYGVISMSKINPHNKIDKKIQNNSFPKWAFNNGILSIKVLFYKNVNLLSVEKKINDLGYDIYDINKFSNSITIGIKPNQLDIISSINEVFYIEPIDPPSFPENKTARTLHRSNTINTNYASGRHYNGEGINIMMQDDGLVEPHIDRKGRVDESFCVGCSSSSSNSHGDHVSGTIMGAGNLDPVAKGMADGAFLYVYGSSNNNYYDVPNIYQNNDVIITSKSYSNGCNAGYTSLAKDLDEQINLYPSLSHIFSAGNDGNSDCGYGAGSGWGNVTGGHKQAKNVIATANLTQVGGLAGSSSRGPAADGRIKPDIGAKGTQVYSTMPNYGYDTKTGTSMACPGIAGVMAQLYQAYKELNNGQNPPSALMKCILLNSADDLGNPGPDFKHGWGEVNAYKAVQILENTNYFSASISQGAVNTHNIDIPAGTVEANIMIYWHDKEASASASIALVNDINTTLTSSSGVTYSPWILDETPNASILDQNATTGIDDLNNMEQITIKALNPFSGSYTLSIDGFSIPYGPQEYWVAYEFISEDVKLTYPTGGESFVPGESEFIRWDASAGNTPFTIEYTTDGGASWNTITNSASTSGSYYNWQVPNNVTSQAKVRISRNGYTDESEEYFTIVNVPNNLNVNWICPDSIYVSWNSVNGADAYEVSILGQKYMDSVATTTTNNTWVINPFPSVLDNWFSVCAKVNGKKGRRAIAINEQPINSGCYGPPTAYFAVSDPISCSGEVSFIDQSQNQPSNWYWNFGDGNISSLQNPTHTYLSEGNYNVSLFVSNGLGQDSILQTSIVTVDFPPAPSTTNDTSFTSPSTFTLTASSSSVNWYADTLGSSPIGTGSTFITPMLSANTTYYVRTIGGPSIFGGPLDNTIGSGGLYNNDRHLFIDCYKPSILISTDVYAGTSQPITFELRDNNSQVIEDTTITVAVGLNTLELGFDMPVMNDLELGISAGSADLYRNSSGANYPYNISNLASITGHNSPWGDPEYHYFFYNLQLQEKCLSDFASASAIFKNSTNIDDNELDILIYPNPTENNLTVISKENINEINIYDVAGKICLTKYSNSNNVNVNCEQLAKGIYTIHISSHNKKTIKKLLIK